MCWHKFPLAEIRHACIVHRNSCSPFCASAFLCCVLRKVCRNYWVHCRGLNGLSDFDLILDALKIAHTHTTSPSLCAPVWAWCSADYVTEGLDDALEIWRHSWIFQLESELHNKIIDHKNERFFVTTIVAVAVMRLTLFILLLLSVSLLINIFIHLCPN